MYDCSGAGIIPGGGGINNDYFKYITADTKSAPITIDSTSNIYGNRFENVELGSYLSVRGDPTVPGRGEDNDFDQIVALRNPLSVGNGVPAYWLR